LKNQTERESAFENGCSNRKKNNQKGEERRGGTYKVRKNLKKKSKRGKKGFILSLKSERKLERKGLKKKARELLKKPIGRKTSNEAWTRAAECKGGKRRKGREKENGRKILENAGLQKKVGTQKNGPKKKQKSVRSLGGSGNEQQHSGGIGLGKRKRTWGEGVRNSVQSLSPKGEKE